MDALALLAKYAGVDGKTRFYDAADMVPMDGVVRKDWREAVVDDKGRVERIPYELCVLVALRDAVRRREIYVEGAARWCNPEDDLPGDFEATRTVHYAAIHQPLNPRAFIAKRMTAGLDGLSAALADGRMFTWTKPGESSRLFSASLYSSTHPLRPCLYQNSALPAQTALRRE